MKVIKVQKGREAEILTTLGNRSMEDFAVIDQQVARMIQTVRERGDQALFDYSMEFDHVSKEVLQGTLAVSEPEIQEAIQRLDRDVYEALERAAAQIQAYHQKQKEETWTWKKENGVLLGQLIQPVEQVGVYIPGGKAAYPSTVLMNVIPASIAGVQRIVMVTPPGKDGKIHDAILAAAKIAGVHEIYKTGGAQSIAALAYGTETIQPVYKITGPGNIYVARAKRAVFGQVGIDMIAGPSEIAIVAEPGTTPSWIAADLLSQAEHDEMAASILITSSESLAKEVEIQLERQLAGLERNAIARVSIAEHGKIYLTEDVESSIQVANLIAPEHLELLVPDPESYLDQIRNAGAVFLGPYSPEPLGDYYAGPNHTLPTNGTARFASPLGVYDFQKKSSIISYPGPVLKAEKNDILRIADQEGLSAHARSIAIRFEQEELT